MEHDIFLIHWNESEAADLAGQVSADAWRVEVEAESGARAGQRILDRPPTAVIVSLATLPSHGRETAGYVRSKRAGRDIPIIFIDAKNELDAEKALRKVPDAVITTSKDLAATLKTLV